MSLTKKHFEGIAKLLRPHNTFGDFNDPIENRRREASMIRAAARGVTADLAHFLSTQNPAFDRERFLQAAGYYPEAHS